ncbi:hypothetical protein F2P56_031443 [Juglans regia]|uniref:Glycosyltransferase n=2 Tax=Juglans regia TaxID=51240 RepID=A0A2I4GTU5_JUGRE|nr:UDP-glycosyltransferase 88A1-like [Juglans regia]KAF5451154.1 hypothetical protein F2P56_031443 [Juglans regia]
MDEAIVLYPSPAIGHLVSMVELGKLLLTHHPSLTIHILVAPQPYNAGSTAPYISSVSATIPSITFHNLPNVTLPPAITSLHPETLIFELLRLNNPNVHQSLLSISESYTIHALIMDFFCTHALSVAVNLNIPGYYFYTSSASCLASFLYLPTLHRNTTKSFKDLNAIVEVPGIPPVPSWDMPKPVLDRFDKAYEYFLDSSIKMAKSAGILVNSFESLESRGISAISNGLCNPDGPTPPIYYVGPLIASSDKRSAGGNETVPECLKWLDLQPSQSVVFLCFGSLGFFSIEQLKEMAIGLERSGTRFLWVVRNPPTDQDHSLATSAQLDPDLDSLLPEGFLERNKERGLVVKSWAPQVDVLNHEAVGGFVTHCGWNSVLESICAGVPMIGWPLYAEQRICRVSMVKDMRIALPMKESEDRFVSATEVEKRVRELMDSDKGKLIKERTLAMKNEAKAALNEDRGSSRVALNKFFESCSSIKED